MSCLPGGCWWVVTVGRCLHSRVDATRVRAHFLTPHALSYCCRCLCLRIACARARRARTPSVRAARTRAFLCLYLRIARCARLARARHAAYLFLLLITAHHAARTRSCTPLPAHTIHRARCRTAPRTSYGKTHLLYKIKPCISKEPQAKGFSGRAHHQTGRFRAASSVSWWAADVARSRHLI